MSRLHLSVGMCQTDEKHRHTREVVLEICKVISMGTFFLVLTAACQHSEIRPVENQSSALLQITTLQSAPSWGTTVGGDEISAGGFSGLLYLGTAPTGEIEFLSHTDRGPNGEPSSVSSDLTEARPFLLPDFQPRWVRLQANPANGSLKMIGEVLLTDLKGRPLSGQPQWPQSQGAGEDEVGIDLKGRVLRANLNGIDPESLTRDSQGFFWMGEEYRPSLLKFSPEGRLLKRYIPQGSLPKSMIQESQKFWGAKVLNDSLPGIYKTRKINRGFEGMTFANGKVYAMLQSPLPNGSKKSRMIRILEFDPVQETTTAEYLFPVETEKVDKVGDLSFEERTGRFYVLIQNSKTGAEGIHDIFSFQLPKPVEKNMKPEEMDLNDLRSQGYLALPKLEVSLAQVGYDFAEKVEGLAILPGGSVAVVNDNDFGVAGEWDAKTSRVPITRDRQTKLGLIRLKSQTPTKD